MQRLGPTIREKKGHRSPNTGLTPAEPYKQSKDALCSVWLSPSSSSPYPRITVPLKSRRSSSRAVFSPCAVCRSSSYRIPIGVGDDCALGKPSGALTPIRQAGTVIPPAHRSPFREGNCQPSGWEWYHGTPLELGDEVHYTRSSHTCETRHRIYALLYIYRAVCFEAGDCTREQGRSHGEYLQPPLLPMRLWIISSGNR